MEQKEQLLEEKEKELDCERKWHEDYAKKLDTIAHKLLQQDGTRPGSVAWTKAKQSSVAWNKARESPVAWNKARESPVAWNKAKQSQVAWKKAKQSQVAWKKAKKKRLGRMLLPERKEPRRKRSSSSMNRLTLRRLR